MIGTKYTPGLLADLAKTPHLRSLEIPTTPDGQAIASYTKRYTEERECKTTIFDADDVELASTTADCDVDSSRFGCLLDHEVGKVTVFSRLNGLSLSFVVSRWNSEDRDEISVALSTGSSVEFRSEVDAVSVIEETHTAIDTITSFFENDTSFDPWLRICELV